MLSHYEFRRLLALQLICPEQHWQDRAGYENEPDNNVDVNEESVPSSPQPSTASKVGRPRKRKALAMTTRQQTAKMLNSKAPRINNNALHPITGSLAGRLNHTLQHFPDNAANKNEKALRCALHRWVKRDMQVIRNVRQCTVCKVALCRMCFINFHQITAVEDLREYVKSIIPNYKNEDDKKTSEKT